LLNIGVGMNFNVGPNNSHNY